MIGELTDLRLPILVVIGAPVLGPESDEPFIHWPADGWREWRQVRQAIEKAARDPRSRGVPLRLVRMHPPALAALRDTLRAGHAPSAYSPAYPMVHLIGYVTEDGRLRMEQQNGREHPVSPEELAAVFRDAGVEIVLLNACFGEKFAEALIEAGVRAVIAARDEISEPEAALLARELYLHLALEASIGEAHHVAREAVVEAYRQRQLPPLDERGQGTAWQDEAGLHEYGRRRAAQIVLLGDGEARLPLPAASESADKPAFDLGEPPHNLVHPEDVFIGRGRELVQISDWMEEHRFRIIALTGIGGIGKSSLATAAALRNSWRFDGVIYLTAKDTSGPRALTLDDLCREADTVFGLDGALRNLPTPEARRQRLTEALNAHHCLLVLDNLEVLSYEQTAELADLLRRLDPNTGTMALLTLRPEHQPPLVNQTKDHFHHLAVESLGAADAIALLGNSLHSPDDWDKVPSHFSSRTRAQLESLAERTLVPPRKVAALMQLAAAAHHHPLLLDFAAADLRKRDSDWESVLRRLRELRGGDLQEKVEDMIGRMCGDLAKHGPDALTLLQSLLVFSGGASSEALRFVWCGRRVEPESDEAGSFNEPCQTASRAALLGFTADRYDLHPLVRQYLAADRSADWRGRNQWMLAHAAFFLEYARRHQNNHQALERERLNLFAAMDAAEKSGLDGMVVEFALCLFDFLWVYGFWSEGRERIARAVVAAQQLEDHAGQACLLHMLGLLSGDRGEFEEARRHLEQSLAIKEMLSDKTGLAVTLHALGYVARKQGHYEEARRYFEQSLELEKAPGSSLEMAGRAEQAWTLHQLGILHKEQSLDEEAAHYFEGSLALFERLGHQAGRAATLREFGDLCKRGKKYDEARRYYEESLEFSVSVRDRAGAIYKLARLSFLEGKFDAAEDLHDRSLALAGEITSPFWQAHNLRGLGSCALARGRPEEAREFLGDALKIAERLGIPLAEEIRVELKNCG